MRTYLTKAILFLLLTVAFVPCLAQQSGTVSFAYDANGNRITRSINIRKVSENGKDIEAISPMLMEATDIFANTKVSIFPNPTKDKVYLFVESDEEEHVLQMRLTNIAGALIQERCLIVDAESIDLTSLPCGVYLLQLATATEIHVWKIIKN